MDDLRVARLFSEIIERHDSMYGFEKELAKLPQMEQKLDHIFSGGIYIRQLIIPKDSIAIGKRHRYETCNIILRGEISVYMGNGEVNRIKGPFLFTSPPMTKKMVYCHEECVFCNIHPTEETDLAKIEDHFIIPEEEYLLLSSGDINNILNGETK